VSKNFFEYEILSFLKENYIKSNSVILDIGANIGNHSIFFATQCNVSEVYSFEPIKETYLMLKNNIEINNLSSLIKPYNYGVSDGKGYASIDEVPKNNIGGTSIKKDNTGNIELVSIDSFLNLKQLDFIKIDVESFEISVLLGLKETLKKFMPTILIEIFESNFTAANKILIDLGYKIVNEFEGSNYLYINSYTA
jgi:FkbM family methyltransferase